jgi:hypothetical protein
VFIQDSISVGLFDEWNDSVIDNVNSTITFISYKQGGFNIWELSPPVGFIYPMLYTFWLIISGEPSTFAVTAIVPTILHGTYSAFYTTNPDSDQASVYMHITGVVTEDGFSILLPTNWIICDEPVEISRVQITLW